MLRRASGNLMAMLNAIGGSIPAEFIEALSDNEEQAENTVQQMERDAQRERFRRTGQF